MNDKNNCKNRRQIITAFVLGELEPQAAEQLKGHIESCEICRSFYQTLTDEEQMIRSTFSDITRKSDAIQRSLIEQLTELEPSASQADFESLKTSKTIQNTFFKSKIIKLAAAAVIAIVVLGGITFWPSSSQNNGKWWLGPPAAWGQEIMAELEKVTALTYRQRSVRVRNYGPDTKGGLWERRYAAKDKYRREVLDETNNITHIQWTVPDGKGFVKYQIWPEHQCYTKEPEKCPPFYDNIMGWLRRWVRLLDKANRILGTQTLEGRECVGFEISPGMYEGFLVQEPTHIWFDTETKLPVRVERRGIEVHYDAGMKLTLIHDQFNYNAQVPADTFTVRIPEGYINAHPDESDAKQDQMVDANVPIELRNEIVGALKEFRTAVYQQHSEITVEGDLTVYPADKIYLSQDCWRRDSYHWEDKLHKSEWYTIEKENIEDTSADFDEHNFKLIHTTVNFIDKTYSVETYINNDGPRHPVEHILFLAGHVNRADVKLANTKIEGIECFGVEISAGKYGGTPATTRYRMWFDSKTNLPARIETIRTEDKSWKKNTTKKSVRVLDKFEWNAELPTETFIPKIPPDFTLEANSNG
jgi:outer membrane lipoprotein-sorting protein